MRRRYSELAVLAVMVFVMPHIVKGKNVHEMMQIMFGMFFGYVGLGLIIGVIALVVWFRFLKGKGKRRP